MKKGPRKYGILEADIQEIISILKANPKTEKVVLFGSRAKGNFEPGSDIDLAWFGTDLNLKDTFAVSLAYDRLFLPYKLDLILHHQISEVALLDHIERVGIVLFERD